MNPEATFSSYSLISSSAGGETIKGISQQSGARIELQRNPPPNSDPNIKMFTVRGSPQQIDYARQLVEEKIGVRRKAAPPRPTPAGSNLLPDGWFASFRVQSLPWVAHMVLLAHTEDQAHMALQVPLVPQEDPWVRITPGRTTRGLQDHSEFSSF